MRVIDSHTEGEPTRLIVEGGPPLGSGSMALRRQLFASKFDHYRSFAVNEPRGFDALVGALLCEPVDPSCAAGLIFFNNTGYLGMCGHATIGAAVTLAHLARIGPGIHSFETPVGVVQADLLNANEARVDNVASYVHKAGVSVPVEGIGMVTGDIAWGGNWFFLTDYLPCALVPDNIPELTSKAEAIKRALARAGFTGTDGAEIDHVEMFSAPVSPDAHSRNFVLCPGGAYDRSPCGTGTSAKLACLAVSGKLAPGEPWVQESVIGSRFTCSYRLDHNGAIVPSISGSAYVVGQAELFQHPADPFRHGIPTGRPC